MAEDKDLQFLRAPLPTEQPNQCEQVPHDEIHKRPDQAALPRPRLRAPEPSDVRRRRGANPTGLSNAEIGRELYISDTTVKTHITHILHKLDLRDGVQAIVLAYQAGLFTDDR